MARNGRTEAASIPYNPDRWGEHHDQFLAVMKLPAYRLHQWGHIKGTRSLNALGDEVRTGKSIITVTNENNILRNVEVAAIKVIYEHPDPNVGTLELVEVKQEITEEGKTRIRERRLRHVDDKRSGSDRSIVDTALNALHNVIGMDIAPRDISGVLLDIKPQSLLTAEEQVERARLEEIARRSSATGRTVKEMKTDGMPLGQNVFEETYQSTSFPGLLTHMRTTGFYVNLDKKYFKAEGYESVVDGVKTTYRWEPSQESFKIDPNNPYAVTRWMQGKIVKKQNAHGCSGAIVLDDPSVALTESVREQIAVKDGGIRTIGGSLGYVMALISATGMDPRRAVQFVYEWEKINGRTFTVHTDSASDIRAFESLENTVVEEPVLEAPRGTQEMVEWIANQRRPRAVKRSIKEIKKHAEQNPIPTRVGTKLVTLPNALEYHLLPKQMEGIMAAVSALPIAEVELQEVTEHIFKQADAVIINTSTEKMCLTGGGPVSVIRIDDALMQREITDPEKGLAKFVLDKNVRIIHEKDTEVLSEDARGRIVVKSEKDITDSDREARRRQVEQEMPQRIQAGLIREMRNLTNKVLEQHVPDKPIYILDIWGLHDELDLRTLGLPKRLQSLVDQVGGGRVIGDSNSATGAVLEFLGNKNVSKASIMGNVVNIDNYSIAVDQTLFTGDRQIVLIDKMGNKIIISQDGVFDSRDPSGKDRFKPAAIQKGET